MTQRGLFPEGVEVHQNDIAFDRDTRIGEDLQRALDEAAMGVVSGFAVTVNGGDATKVDVASGFGYAPNGEECVLAVGQSALSLADNTLGTVNVVCAIYTETLSDPKPHETSSTPRNTRANRTVRLRVYTQAQFNLLASTDANLANDAQDRALLLASIVATGAGLTGSAITSPTAFNTINTASAPINITGTVITAVSASTPAGTGTLTYTTGGTLMSWQAPGAGAPGAAQNVGGGGTFVLAGGDGSTISVTIISASLPASDKVDSIVITNIYAQSVARFTAEDLLHRNLLGTGTPTKQNPHGIRVEDIGGVGLAELETHQDIQHSNGIWRGSSANALLVSIDETTSPDRLLVVTPGGTDTYYVDGKRLSTIAASVITFGAAPANAVLYEVLLNNAGNLSISNRAQWPNPRTVTGVEIIDMSDGTAAGSGTLAFTSAGSMLSWAGGAAVGVGAGGRFRLTSADDFSVLEVHIVAASLPGANQSDSITINALSSTDALMRIGMVCWTGSATGFLGYTPNRGVTAAQLLDKRFFGNLASFERQDEVVQNRVRPETTGPDSVAQVTVRYLSEERTMAETRVSGVFIGGDRLETDSLDVSAGAGLTVVTDGGVAYVFGKRYEVAPVASVAVVDAATNNIYVDAGGNVRSVNNATISVQQIIGTGLPNSPGFGAMLAQVVTAGGVVTQVIDFRRDLSALDNKGYFTITSRGSTSLGSVGKAQFGSLQAAKAYADALTIREIRIVGSLTEVVNTTLSLPTNKLRIVCSSESTISISGIATALFSVTATGPSGLVIEGGTWSLPSGMHFVTHGGGTSSYTRVQHANITLAGAANLWRNTTATVSGRGVKFENCSIVGGTSPIVNFTTGWDGVLGFYKCKIDGASSIFITDTLGGADTINTVEVVECEVIATSGVTSTADAVHADWKIIDTRFTVSGAVYDMDGTATRLTFRGCYFDGTSGIILDPASSKTYTDVWVVDCVYTLSFTGSKFACGANGRLSRTYIKGCTFQDPASGTPSAISIQPTAGTSEEIHIVGNTFFTGRIILGGAGTKKHVTIADNVIFGSVNQSGAAAIFLDDATTLFTVTANKIASGGGAAGDICGIRVDAACDHGTIKGNIIAMTSVVASNDGIRVTGTFVTVADNEIEIDGTGASRMGIHIASSDCTVVGNVLTVDDAGIGSNAIILGGPRCVCSGNRIEMTAAAADGDAIQVDSAADDSTVAGNAISFTNAGASADGAGIRCSADRTAITGNSIFAPDAANVTSIDGTGHSLAVTGNRCSATAAAPDVSLTGNRNTFVGNVITNAAGSAAGTATVSGTASVNANNIP